MDWTTQSTPFSELHQQTVALKDLELGRWRPATSYGTLTSSEVMHEGFVSTSLEDIDTGMVSPGSFSRDDDFSSTTSSDDEDDGPGLDTPVEYARFHGLCRDYEMDHPLSSVLIPAAQGDPSLVADEPGGALFPEALLAEVHDSLNERLDVDKQAASFLMSILKTCKQDESSQINVGLAVLSPMRLRLELPVLASDHEVEMAALRCRHEVRLTSRGIETFQLDTEKGESLVFSSAEIKNKDRLDRELQNEKLDVGKETVEIFRQLRDLTSGEEVDLVNETYNSYKKSKAIRLSPPLLPVTPPYSPPAPASEAMQIDLTSSPEDLIAKDAAALEIELLAHAESATTPTDQPSFDTQEVAASIKSYIAAPSSSSPLARKRLRSLRVEAPLTPQCHTGFTSEEEPTSKKAKRVQYDLDVTSLLPNLQLDGSDKPSGLAQQQMDDLQDAVKRGAESVQQELLNEQLIEIDTTMRVKVPSLEAVQIQPLWDLCSSSEDDMTRVQNRRTMLQDVSKTLLQDVRKWGGVAKMERSLPWAPFAAYLAKVDLVEQFDDGSLERYLTDLRLDGGAGDVDVHAMVARSSQTGILGGHESDDEEVEPIVTEEDGFVDETPGLSKPAPEIPTGAPPIVKSGLLDVLQVKRRGFAGSTETPPQKAALETLVASRSDLGGSTTLMPNDGIAQFMQLRGKTANTQGANGKASNLMNDKLAQPAAQKQAPAAVMIPEAESYQSEARPTATIPIPKTLIKSNASIPTIVSSTTMANRHLIRRVQTALPNIELCERDALIPTPTHHTSEPRPEEEADFTISASTGIITTTLQKLKQRHLPGLAQAPTSSVRTTISSTSTRYERLLVLVSEANTIIPTDERAPPRPLDPLDREALANLTTWATHSFGSAVQISYIPGGEQELASRLASVFAQHGNTSTEGGLRLQPDETMEERWLRVAGLNAYAAQAVLAQLEAPDDRDYYLDSDYGALAGQERFGVAAFVAMSVEERVERFGALLGGERVLRRVSEAIA